MTLEVIRIDTPDSESRYSDYFAVLCCVEAICSPFVPLGNSTNSHEPSLKDSAGETMNYESASSPVSYVICFLA
jgi:hypothetical protein